MTSSTACIARKSSASVPRVEARSKLFMTFGSPLDKIAFLFAIQGSNREGREALAASTQPVIAFPSRRPRWVNIYSGWDIISGSLEFYDKAAWPQGGREPRATPKRRVWLAAHTRVIGTADWSSIRSRIREDTRDTVFVGAKSGANRRRQSDDITGRQKCI